MIVSRDTIVGIAETNAANSVSTFLEPISARQTHVVKNCTMRTRCKIVNLMTVTLLLFPGIAAVPTVVAIAQTAQDHKAEADRLVQQGALQYQMRQFDTAFQSWQQALTIYRRLQERRGEGTVLAQLGLGYGALGNHDKAIDYYEQLLAVSRALKDRLGEGFALSSLGSSYLELGQYDKAADWHRQSLAIARALKNRHGEGQELRNLGIAYFSLGEYDKAIAAHQQSLAIAREVKDLQWQGISLVDLGTTYSALGESANAIDFLQQGLAIARTLQDRQGEMSALGNLALVYQAQQNYARAIEIHQQSLAIIRATQDRYAEGLTLHNMGVSFFQSGQLVQAEQTLQACIQMLESLRINLGNHDAAKVAIFEQQLRTYRTLQQVLIAQNKTDAALEISEQGRARVFVELLSTRLVNGRDGTAPQVPTAIVAPTIAQIRQVAHDRNATLVQYSIIYDQFQIGKRQEWKESQLFIWVIAPNGTITFRTTDLKPLWQQQETTLEKLVTTSRQTIGVRSRDDRRGISVAPSPAVQRQQQEEQTRTLRQLHQLLIAPIADRLPLDPMQPVIFMPQQALFLAPFPALQDGNGKYLVEQHTMLTAPSIQVLQLTQSPPTNHNDAAPVLIVGNPTMPTVSLEPGQPARPLTALPAAETEATAIAPLFKTRALIGRQATKATVVQQMPQARIIHLATHGLLDDVRGLGSAIALAPEHPDGHPPTPGNGLLTAAEILAMRLQAQLVVLSACDTGRGRITGDGVIGLSRSFLSAGVASVIVSLWAVPDAPTAELMQAFYKNWRTQDMNKAQALRQAMLTMMKTHPHPQDWAAFTLIGAP